MASINLMFSVDYDFHSESTDTNCYISITDILVRDGCVEPSIISYQVINTTGEGYMIVKSTRAILTNGINCGLRKGNILLSNDLDMGNCEIITPVQKIPVKVDKAINLDLKVITMNQYTAGDLFSLMQKKSFWESVMAYLPIVGYVHAILYGFAIIFLILFFKK